MTVNARRFIYGLLAALGFALMIPFAVGARLWRADVASGSAAAEVLVGAGELVGPALVGAVGFLLAAVFLYAALTAGQPALWRPHENGEVLCRRCGELIGFGVRRCPSCGQQLVW